MKTPPHAPQEIPAGWYPDPVDPSLERHWLGSMWSKDQVRPVSSVRSAIYPPQTAPYRKAPKQKRPHPLRTIIVGVFFGIVAVVVLIVVLVGVAASHSNTPGKGSSAHPAASDVTVNRCYWDSIRVGHAATTIVNHSSQMSDYLYTVNFSNPAGTIVGQGYGGEDNIPAGATAQDDVVGPAPGGASALPVLRCTVTGVQRFASG